MKAEVEIEDMQAHLHSIEATLERIEATLAPGAAALVHEDDPL